MLGFELALPPQANPKRVYVRRRRAGVSRAASTAEPLLLSEYRADETSALLKKSATPGRPRSSS